MVFKSMPMYIKNLLITESHLGLDIISMYPNPIKKTQEILSNLRGVRKLGYSLTVDRFECLAKLPCLSSLSIEISRLGFYKFPEAIDDTQRLTELSISIDNVVLTRAFANYFKYFKHLIKLSIFIGENVGDSSVLLGPVGLLAKNRKLHTLVLAGCVEYFDLEHHRSALDSIKNLEIIGRQWT